MSLIELSADKGILDLLQNFIKSQGLSEDSKIEFEKGAEAGDGYVGLTAVAKITSENEIVKLFVKFAPKSGNLRNRFGTRELFQKEIYFYNTVYPQFLKFQEERKTKNPFKTVPQCYGTKSEDKHETLLLENLKETGYVLFDKNVQMNGEHISAVFREYARFHAVSYAMRDQDVLLYENIGKPLVDCFGELIVAVGFDKALKSYVENARKLFDPETDALILKGIINLAKDLEEFAVYSKNFADEYSVILHGDCWCNNMMYKYKDISSQNSPSEIKILDWQLMRINSPVFDLAYFFYGVATKETLTNLDVYLKIYHDKLSNAIQEMGSDPNKLYPYTLFRNQWRRFSRFGLMMAFSIIKMMLTDKDEVPIMLTDQDETPNVTEAAQTETGITDAYYYSIKKEDLYKERLKDVIEHFVRNKFLESFYS